MPVDKSTFSIGWLLSSAIKLPTEILNLGSSTREVSGAKTAEFILIQKVRGIISPCCGRVSQASPNCGTSLTGYPFDQTDLGHMT